MGAGRGRTAHGSARWSWTSRAHRSGSADAPGSCPTGPDASTVSYDGDLRSTLPLFGSAIENAAAGAVRAALEVEQDVARRWIADHA